MRNRDRIALVCPGVGCLAVQGERTRIVNFKLLCVGTTGNIDACGRSSRSKGSESTTDRTIRASSPDRQATGRRAGPTRTARQIGRGAKSPSAET